MIHRTLQRIAMWLVWNGPYLGKWGPVLFDFAMGQKGKLVPQKGVESKQPDKYAAHYLACILRVTGGLEGPCDCGVGSSPRRGADHE